jgi:Ceramidase
MLLRPIPQVISYHNFADKRSFFGIPNFLNVISNFPFIIVGIIGLSFVKQSKASRDTKIMYGFLFFGIFLTGLGSAYYHYCPNNNSLVFDRLPMTIVFMALLSATLADGINPKLGMAMLFPLIFFGICSVAWWHYTELHGAGDLRAYILAQFYPVVFIPLILVLFPQASTNRGIRQLVWVVIWYILAKLLEQFDQAIFSATGFVSGHTLKHLAAAVATWYLVRLFKEKQVFARSDK